MLQRLLLTISMKYFPPLKKAKLPFLFLISFCIAIGVFAFVKQTFTVSSVEIVGSDHLAGVDEVSGKFLFFLNEKETEEMLYKKNPIAQSIKIKKEYPHTIHVKVVKDEIRALLKATDGYFSLTKDGRVVVKGKTALDTKPIINSFERLYLRSYPIGAQIEARDVVYSLFFITKLADLDIRIQTVDILGFDVLVFKEEHAVYLVTISKDKEEQYAQMKTLINHFAIEGQDYSSLDVRFDKPIVKFIDGK